MAPAISARGAQVIAWSYVTFSIAAFFVSLRLLVRWKVVRFIGKEDACIFLALVCSFPLRRSRAGTLLKKLLQITALICCVNMNLGALSLFLYTAPQRLLTQRRGIKRRTRSTLGHSHTSPDYILPKGPFHLLSRNIHFSLTSPSSPTSASCSTTSVYASPNSPSSSSASASSPPPTGAKPVTPFSPCLHCTPSGSLSRASYPVCLFGVSGM